MALTRRFAKNRYYGQGHAGRFEPPVLANPQGGAAHISKEEAAFVALKIEAGLSNIEVSRMFYRKFSKDISPSTVRWHRLRIVGGDQ